LADDGDFALQNGQLIKSESGENTGFKYELDGRTIVVTDSKTGSQHKFKLPQEERSLDLNTTTG
jgi:YD repeat-containing protein